MIVMISSTGNKSFSQRALGGFTFLELMLTIMVLSLGITAIYKGMITLLDYQNQLTSRLYAANLMDHEVALLEKRFLDKGTVPAAENGKTFQAYFNYQPVTFQFMIEEVKFPTLKGVSHIHLTLTWPSRDRTLQLKKSIVLVNPYIKAEEKKTEATSAENVDEQDAI